MKLALDHQVLEERTQAIGRELFAAARREHAHLSVLNRWTTQVLSWCLSDPALKADVLRFIDALPSLTTSREIAEHVRDYFPTTRALPPALRLGTQIARSGLLTHAGLAAVIRQLVEQVARQFIAEHHPEGVVHAIQALAARGATCSLDVLGEQVLTEAEADRYAAQCAALLRQCADAYAQRPATPPLVTASPLVNLSVKPSALSPRFDPISPAQSVERAFQCLQPLLELASEHGAVLNLDMEQYELRDLTLDLAKRALLHPEHGTPGAGLGIVVQAYLRDADESLEALLDWLASHERALTIRLVKGAYWDSEVAVAIQNHWPVPVYDEKAETDVAFERLTRRLLSAAPLVTAAIASHNARSIAHAMAAAELLGLKKNQLEFQLLYGMGESLHAAIAQRGYPVRIYTPIGELIPGMAYLVRRLLENTANESFLRQDFFEERQAEELLKPPTPVEAERAGAIRPPSSSWRAEPLQDFSKPAGRDRMAQAIGAVKAKRNEIHPILLGAQAVRTSTAHAVRNPAAPSELVGTMSFASLDDVERAVQIANTAQPAWARTPVRERTACLRRAATLIRERREELAAWETVEVGKTWREADVDVVEAIEYLEYYSSCMEELARGKPLIQMPGERNAYAYLPRGVAVVIAPWNFPSAIFMGMASAALVTGNAVILKPASQSSIIGLQIAQILRASGIPQEIVQCLPGRGEEIGTALVRHPGAHAVLFTGSRAVGQSIVESCGQVAPGQRFFKHVIAELGGKNAVIIDADADLDAAVAGTLRSAFGYGGQKCSAASRAIVLEPVYDRFLSRLAAATDRLAVGDPADPATDLGPLIDETAQRRLRDAIAHAKDVGTIAYQYPASRMPTEGHFVGPAIVTDVPRQDRLATEELFGPLLCVFRAKTFEAALELANDTDYALTGGVYSRSPSHLELAVRLFDVGNLYLNRPITGAMVGRQPFGGHRLSGLGTKAGGPDYLLQLLIPKTVCANTTRHGMPLD